MTTLHSTESIWTHLSSDLRRFIRRRVPDDHLAEDLLQEVFVRIHRGVATLHDADRLEAWVYRIVRNVITDHFRRLDRTLELADADPVDDAEDPQSQTRCRSTLWLDEMIRTLPDGYRDAVRLAEIDGLPQAEVGVRLGLSVSGAKSRIQRGRALLKGALEQCCQLEFDGRGAILDCEPNPSGAGCSDCSQ